MDTLIYLTLEEYNGIITRDTFIIIPEKGIPLSLSADLVTSLIYEIPHGQNDTGNVEIIPEVDGLMINFDYSYAFGSQTGESEFYGAGNGKVTDIYKSGVGLISSDCYRTGSGKRQLCRTNKVSSCRCYGKRKNNKMIYFRNNLTSAVCMKSDIVNIRMTMI